MHNNKMTKIAKKYTIILPGKKCNQNSPFANLRLCILKILRKKFPKYNELPKTLQILLDP